MSKTSTETHNDVAVVTGAGGTLCSAMAIDLARTGIPVVLIGRTLSKLQAVEERIQKDGGRALAIATDVSVESEVIKAAEKTKQHFGYCTILINGAGGNQSGATTTINQFSPDELTTADDSLRGFFSIQSDDFMNVIEVNTMGTVIPCKIFVKQMVEYGGGSIINIASMNSYRPLSRVPAYGIAKAGIANFTQWLANYLAPANIRVNAIAPGFFLNERSRGRLTTEDGGYTERGENIIAHTPMKRFGEPHELLGCMRWLIDNEKAGFVSGTVIPIDGGFIANSGV